MTFINQCLKQKIFFWSRWSKPLSNIPIVSASLKPSSATICSFWHVLFGGRHYLQRFTDQLCLIGTACNTGLNGRGTGLWFVAEGMPLRCAGWQHVLFPTPPVHCRHNLLQLCPAARAFDNFSYSPNLELYRKQSNSNFCVFEVLYHQRDRN